MSEQRESVTFLVAGGLSVPRACALVQIPRSTFRYVAQGHDDTELLAQIRELAATTRVMAIAALQPCCDVQHKSTRNVCGGCGKSSGCKYSA